jgi:hypothetical protein
MGLVRTQKEGDGMYISGNGRDIELTVLEVKGIEFHRKVKLGIKGLESIEEIEISADQGYVGIYDTILIEVGNRRDRMPGFASLNYEASLDYKFKRKIARENRRVSWGL